MVHETHKLRRLRGQDKPTRDYSGLRKTTPCRPEATRALLQFHGHHGSFMQKKNAAHLVTQGSGSPQLQTGLHGTFLLQRHKCVMHWGLNSWTKLRVAVYRITVHDYALGRFKERCSSPFILLFWTFEVSRMHHITPKFWRRSSIPRPLSQLPKLLEFFFQLPVNKLK